MRRSAAIINDYTREAGVRNLEREIGTVFRKIARKIAENPRFKARVKPENLAEYLSKPRFFNEVRKRVASVGVATGLAYTPVGGDILFIETQGMPGTGKLVLTGQLGDVMKESAQAAVSFLRSRSSELGLPSDYFAEARHARSRPRRRDAERRPVGRNRAGDVDRFDAHRSQGRSEPGNDRRDYPDRASAADRRSEGESARRETRRHQQRSCCRERNEIDLDDIPKEVRDTMTFVPVEELSEVLHHALGKRIISPVPLGAR